MILNSNEPHNPSSPIVHLHYLLLCVLVKLSRTRATTLQGLQENVIPIIPSISSIRLEMPSTDNQRTYAFTDYRSQGQSISHVIMDLASPPSGSLSLFNIYVALSRSSGRDTIRLLRDFEDNIFTKKFDANSLTENDRLQNLDRKRETNNKLITYTHACNLYSTVPFFVIIH
jgi:hypothetical protein